MHHYYGIDLRDVVNGEMDPALVSVLIEALPQGSAFGAMARDEEHWRYYLGADQTFYLLASIFDAINNNTRATGNFKRPPKFKPWPTPESLVKEEIKRSKPKSLADLFGRVRQALPT